MTTPLEPAKLPPPGTRRYTCEMHQAGQPRAYADSVYDFTITVEWVPYSNPPASDWVPNDLAIECLLHIAKAIGKRWYDKDERTADDWHLSTLKSKTKVSEGKWRFVVTEAYTD